MVTSRRLFGLIACLLVGLGLANLADRKIWTDLNWLVIVPIWVSVGLALLLIAHWFSVRSVSILVTGLLPFGLGFLWGSVYLEKTHPGPIIYDVPVQITGTIVTFPEFSGRWQRFVVVTEDFGRKDRVQVTTAREPRRQRGERLVLVGTLKRPKNTPDFPESDVLTGRGIFATLSFPKSVTMIKPALFSWRLITTLRDRIVATITAVLPEPAASLALGLTIGIDPDIDRDFVSDLRRANLTHLAAVSGQNISILILYLFRRFRAIALKPAIWLSFCLLVFYTILTGAAASIVRAAIMTGFIFMAILIGRAGNSLRALLLAAALISLANPRVLVGDVGFVLSFFAMTGILLFSPVIEHRLGRLPRSLRELIGMTTAATVAVMPIQIVTFGTISTVGILANLLVGPLVFLAMAGGFGLALAGFIQFDLAQILGLVLYPVYEIIHLIAGWLGSPQLAQVNLVVSPAVGSILIGSSLFIFAFFIWRRLRRPVLLTSILE